MTKRVYRAALLGTGAIAGAHMDAFRKAGRRIEVVAALDIDADRVRAFGDKYGIPHVYTNVDALLKAEKPDLVQICTPPATHVDLAIASLEAGAWVNCEKPLCASLAEFDRITEAENRTGRYVNTIFQWRSGTAARHLKSLIEDGELGRPLVGNCLTLWYRTPAYYQAPWRGRYETEFGGPTFTLGIHLTDLFLWLIGDWAEVQAQIATLDRPIQVEDVSTAMIRFENGMLGNIVNSALSPRQETYLRLDFQRATVEIKALYSASNQHFTYSLPDGVQDDAALQRWRNPTIGDLPGDHTPQLMAMLDSIDRNERPPISGLEARRIIEFNTCLYKSALTRQPIQRGSIQPGDPFYASVTGK